MAEGVKVRIVCVSDTHNAAPGEGFTLPKGDILIHAGDLTNQGSHSELQKAIKWLAAADFAVNIVVAGNHDLSLDANYTLRHEEGWSVIPEDVEKCRELVRSVKNLVYLQHECKTIAIPGKDTSIRVFGSPYSGESKKQNWAFQYNNSAAEATWAAIPAGIDVLITHTPPAGICDASKHWQDGGCTALTEAISRTKPKLHVCGHCHEGRGASVVRWTDQIDLGAVRTTRDWVDPGKGSKKQSLLDLTGKLNGALEPGVETAVINASIMAKSYDRGGKEFNKPIVVDVILPRADE